LHNINGVLFELRVASANAYYVVVAPSNIFATGDNLIDNIIDYFYLFAL